MIESDEALPEIESDGDKARPEINSDEDKALPEIESDGVEVLPEIESDEDKAVAEPESKPKRRWFDLTKTKESKIQKVNNLKTVLTEDGGWEKSCDFSDDHSDNIEKKVPEKAGSSDDIGKRDAKMGGLGITKVKTTGKIDPGRGTTLMEILQWEQSSNLRKNNLVPEPRDTKIGCFGITKVKKAPEKAGSSDEHNNDIEKKALEKAGSSDEHNNDIEKKALEKAGSSDEHNNDIEKKALEKAGSSDEHNNDIEKKALEKAGSSDEDDDDIEKGLSQISKKRRPNRGHRLRQLLRNYVRTARLPSEYKRTSFSRASHGIIVTCAATLGLYLQISQLIYQRKLGDAKVDPLERTYKKMVFVFGVSAYIYVASVLVLRMIPARTFERHRRLGFLVDEMVSIPAGLIAITTMNSPMSVGFSVGVGIMFAIILVCRYIMVLCVNTLP